MGETFNSLGDRIFMARLDAGLTQAEVAARAGLPASSISHFERNHRKPSFDNIPRLAHALQSTCNYLCGTSDRRGTSLSEASDLDLAQELAVRMIRASRRPFDG